MERKGKYAPPDYPVLTTITRRYLTGHRLWDGQMQFDINQVLRIDAKMYRHFALFTLIITACVGFFADGENREAVANEMDKRDQQVALRKAEEEKQSQANRPAFENRAGSGPAMADEGIGDYGSPMDQSSGKGSASALPLRLPGSGLPNACGREAADRNALARMNKLQRDAYLAKLDEMDCDKAAKEARPHQPTRSEISALAAASAARSGSSEID